MTGQAEREALIDAAEMAGLNVLSLVEENTAAAVQYGIDRVFENDSHIMMVYNMGAESTQVSIFEYTAYRTKVGKQLISCGNGWADGSYHHFSSLLRLSPLDPRPRARGGSS